MAALTAFSPNTTILSADTNSNNTTIRSTYNAHDTATTSVHGITSPSVIVGSNEVQTLLNKSIYSTSDIKNLALTQAAGVHTLKGGDGSTALSSTNKAFIPVSSVTAGKIYEMPVTSNIVINDIDSGVSNLIGIKFGINESYDWDEDMNWYIGVANKSESAITGVDGASCYFLTRNFAMDKTPVAANIGKFGTNPATDDETSIVLCGTGYTTSGYENLPCRIIGSFRTKYIAGSTDWRIQTLAYTDGINKFNLYNQRTMPDSQNGAGSGKFSLGNGPSWSTNEYYYYTTESGFCIAQINLRGTCTNGSGTSSTYISLPFKAMSSMQARTCSMDGQITYGSTTLLTTFTISNNESAFFMPRWTAITTQANAQNNGWSNAADTISVTLIYKIF